MKRFLTNTTVTCNSLTDKEPYLIEHNKLLFWQYDLLVRHMHNMHMVYKGN